MADALTDYEIAIMEQAATHLRRGMRTVAANVGRSERTVYKAANGHPVSEHVRDEILSYCLHVCGIDLDYRGLTEADPEVRQAATELIANGMDARQAVRSAKRLRKIFAATPELQESHN
jgi:hypothetical protein